MLQRTSELGLVKQTSRMSEFRAIPFMSYWDIFSIGKDLGISLHSKKNITLSDKPILANLAFYGVLEQLCKLGLE